MDIFEVVLVGRTPHSSGLPTLTVIDRLVVDNLSYFDELNRPGGATVSCPIQSLSDSVKARLANLAAYPSEVWIYSGNILASSSEIQTISMRGQSVELGCVGLLGYLHRMGITSDLVYSATDQFTIAKGMVNQWQNQPYGNYGINTGPIGTSGVVRDRTYLRNELHNVGQRIEELAAVIDGFDFVIDPTYRVLSLFYPKRGLDLTQSVFLDQTNIDSAAVAVAVGPDDLVSDVSATGSGQGTTGQSITLYSARSTPSVEASYGRSWNSQTYSGVTVQATLDGHADAYLATRSQQFFQPGVTIVPRIGADINDLHPGDLVSYSYDAGLGLQSGSFRISKLTMTVKATGEQRIGIEFA